MKIQINSSVLTRQKMIVLTFFLLTLALLIGIVFKATLSAEMAAFLFPTLATFTIFALFSICLKWQVGNNLFGELGFLY